MALHVEQLTVNPFSENTYVLIRDGEALIIDPGFYFQAEFAQLERLLQKHEAVPITVLLTHAHVDHIFGVPAVVERWPELKVYRHPDEVDNWNGFEAMAARFGLKTRPLPDQVTALLPQKTFSIGPFTMEIRHVPGHSKGHLVFYFAEEEVLIAGDTLFQGSIGRTDLPGGDFETLENALKTQVYTLPGTVKVFPGHGSPTTIDHEALTNPYVRP